MTEKQFGFKDEYITLDGGFFATAGNKNDAELIGKTLNQLLEENQQVKKVLQKYMDKYTRRAIEGHPYSDVTEAISDIADELGVELE